MATESDAARDRVLAARQDLAEQLELLQASGRAAVDIPAKIRQSPAKAAALAGGVGFLALKGPQRLFGAAKRAVRGPSEPLPKSMLPEEIDKTLRKLGNDGDKVRGALERDFADYAKRAEKSRQGLRALLVTSLARPLLSRGAKAASEFLFSTEDGGFNERIARLQERAEREAARLRERATDAAPPAGERPTTLDREPPAGI